MAAVEVLQLPSSLRPPAVSRMLNYPRALAGRLRRRAEFLPGIGHRNHAQSWGPVTAAGSSGCVRLPKNTVSTVSNVGDHGPWVRITSAATGR